MLALDLIGVKAVSYTHLGKEQFYSRELQYLLDNGYKFVDEGGIWHAVR